MAEPNFSGERTIIEYWASVGESNAANRFASSLPWFLGGPIYLALYVAKALNLGAAVRYTLTNRRLRVDRGMRKRTVQSIPLEEIEDVRLAESLPFTRTGDLEIISGGKVALRMRGIQDPAPARLTILDAAQARAQVQKVLRQQQRARSAKATPAPAAT